MSVKAASASARIASRGTIKTSSPKTFSRRTPSLEIFRYGVSSLPSGNSGVCLYGGVGCSVSGAFMGYGSFAPSYAGLTRLSTVNRRRQLRSRMCKPHNSMDGRIKSGHDA